MSRSESAIIIAVVMFIGLLICAWFIRQLCVEVAKLRATLRRAAAQQAINGDTFSG